ncbi:DEAD/DEAH box helicase [Paraoerskovia sediminicola]|uniref:Type I restriction enzyme endonuclease subunit n=1 Tax=Paraoerskovia sediminicola TaxID=1138587 RepID=A0ABM8G524_9CELL|nr:DEAD/DEAH box helicase [Paraoerskovia sediminicola]
MVAAYESDDPGSQRYQSEADLEAELVGLLQVQAYEYLPIASESDLVANLRHQLELLNAIVFSDAEWDWFYNNKVSSRREGVVEKTVRIQEDPIQILARDDGTSKNIRLIDKAHIHNNRLQVINQYEVPGADEAAGMPSSSAAKRANRYDVTILVNGLPMVHVELKRRGVDVREAFNQIDRYQRDSFWSGSGLFEYVQLFVISNGTLTKYYSNTVRASHLDEQAKRRASAKRTSNSFEFTSWWADATNRPITDLVGFTKTFFAKHSLLNVLTKYCVLTADRMLLVMRPYQIAATEQILTRIETSSNQKRFGTLSAGGYVWHTTGSGKTLTSFKTAQLASKMEGLDKVLFVVDRKDLDYQTMREYDRFQKGAANSNSSTAVLKRQLEDPGARIIITTVQKLSTFIKQNAGHAVYTGHVVIIFDECHRSQFGDMHTAITRAFKRYHLFGFTGTPIFAENAGTGGAPTLRTTAQAFGDKLHTYTIVDAINDKNVLPFRIDYINTVKVREGLSDKEVAAIDTDAARLDLRRIRNNVEYTLDHFDQKTRRNTTYRLKDRRVAGFNALFATESVRAAKIYYNMFGRVQEERGLPDAKRLKVGLIFSYAANESAAEEAGGLLGEEEFETYGLDDSSRAFLEDAIQDYNDMFGTSFDTSAEKFQNYYKDLSLRTKNREIDLVIVVNMFLTGFDATTMNTLWVDKNLRAHGLIQAYSRTNRILNSVKTYGNIVSFRNLEQETQDALALFGNEDATGIVLLAPYAEYFGEYADKVTELREQFSPGQMPVGEQAAKDFIAVFGAILRLRNILVSFDEFAAADALSVRDRQDFQSVYLELWNARRGGQAAERESITDDVTFEIELIKQVEINVDYILMLVEQYRATRGDGEDSEIKEASTAPSTPRRAFGTRGTSSRSLSTGSPSTMRLLTRGARTSRPSVGRSWTGSSSRRSSNPKPRARSSTTPSATGQFGRPAPRSPRSCRPSHGLAGVVRAAVTEPRSRTSSTSSPRSSSGSST